MQIVRCWQRDLHRAVFLGEGRGAEWLPWRCMLRCPCSKRTQSGFRKPFQMFQQSTGNSDGRRVVAVAVNALLHAAGVAQSVGRKVWAHGFTHSLFCPCLALPQERCPGLPHLGPAECGKEGARKLAPDVRDPAGRAPAVRGRDTGRA